MKKLMFATVALVIASPVSAQQLSRQEELQLNQLLGRKAEVLLASAPRSATNHQGYVGDQRGHLRLPAGCTEVRVHDAATRHTFVRVNCRGAYTAPARAPGATIAVSAAVR
jgi:hypothetical protein